MRTKRIWKFGISNEIIVFPFYPVNGVNGASGVVAESVFCFFVLSFFTPIMLYFSVW